MDLITTHLHADFDCVASMVAAKKLYPEAQLVFPGSQEKQVRDFLDRGGFELHYRRLKGLPMDSVRLLVVVDASTRERIGIFAPVADRANVSTHIYDHHPPGSVDVPHQLAVIRDRGSTVTIFTEIFQERGISITPSEATLMMLGLYEDTGFLTFSSVCPEDYQAARWLLEQGADLDIVKTSLAQELSAPQVELLNSLLKNLRFYQTGGVSVAVAQATAARYVGDLSSLAHRIMDMENPAALFVLVRMDDRIHLIGRSRVEGLDAGAVAASLGGGGHPTAASATIRDLMMPQVMDKLREAIDMATQSALRAGDIMVERPVTVETDATVDQAGALMARFDFGGMPVLRGGMVEGLITRRIAEKAIHHGMGQKPVKEFMLTEFATVNPDTPAGRLEEIILEGRQKMAPVVDPATGALAGIITRGMALGKLYGDSLKRQGRLEGGGKRREPLTKNVANVMKELLPERQMRILSTAAEAGDELGFPVYVAGGFPRDLLMRAPSSDMDIVTEGDGVALAAAMAARLGGRSHAHEKFKTAVVVLPGGAKVDVATARIEFYSHPAALPEVEHGAIRNDLYRRDFSINAMAIRLNGPRPGSLIDYFGGQADLKNHVIRVLHNLSFVEDPTRAFRAARFETRFGFTMGKQTLSLLENAVRHQLFNRLSGERMISEVVMILNERRPVPALARLKELGLLKFVHPGLRFGPGVERVMERLEDLLAWRSLAFPEKPVRRWLAHLMALMDTLDGDEMEGMRRAYQSSKHVVELAARSLEEADLAAKKLGRAGAQAPLSVAWEALGKLADEPLLFLAAKSSEGWLRDMVTRFMAQAPAIRPLLTGDDLLKIGVTPSRKLGRILETIFMAQLDGRVKEREEALQMAKILTGQ